MLSRNRLVATCVRTSILSSLKKEKMCEPWTYQLQPFGCVLLDVFCSCVWDFYIRGKRVATWSTRCALTSLCRHTYVQGVCLGQRYSTVAQRYSTRGPHAASSIIFWPATSRLYDCTCILLLHQPQTTTRTKCKRASDVTDNVKWHRDECMSARGTHTNKNVAHFLSKRLLSPVCVSFAPLRWQRRRAK